MKRLKWLLISLIAIASLIGEPALALVKDYPPEYTTVQVNNTIINTYSWGYEYLLENGDTVQVGDNTTDDFKAMIKTIRQTGLCDFSIGFSGGTFTPSLNGDTVSFNFNSQVSISIYPVPPCERLPEGGIEYDVQLLSRPAQNNIDMNIDWNGITWQKVLPLDEEYDLARCIDDFGDIYENFILTPTEITGELIETGLRETIKSRPEYEVNSYLGICNEATDTTYDMGISTAGNGTGKHIYYHRISKSYLYIHRGIMTDSDNNTAWVEDINIDEVQKDITFTLPRDWLKNATYPVNQVCGVDPAYTEQIISSGQAGTDGAWEEIDINTVFSLNLGTTNVVLEMMLENQQKGTENQIGVRATDSSLNRYVNLHEAEPDGGGGGDTHCRMFVQTITNGSSQQGIDIYTEDASDTEFYILGYWENVSFTEAFDNVWFNGSWIDRTLSNGASCVHQILALVDSETASDVGVRENGSSLSRYFKLHEAEGGGNSYIDFLVKADSSKIIETYGFIGDYGQDTGYFSSELDFVELWQSKQQPSAGWVEWDITSYLDEDGRVVDVTCLHNHFSNNYRLGVRGGDSSATRYLWEHEAEDNGTSTGELTGFSMSAISNSSGVIDTFGETSIYNYGYYYLSGYFKPSSAVAINNTPSSYNFGIVSTSDNVSTGLDYFTVTNNNSGTSIDIAIYATDFTGGVGWTLSDTATPGADTAGLRAGLDGGSYNIIIKKNSPYNDLVTSLSDNATQDWGIQLSTPTSHGDGVLKETTVTLSASSS